MTSPLSLTILQDSSLLQRTATEYQNDFDQLKAKLNPPFPWYPYGTLNNFTHLRPLLDSHPLVDLIGAGRVADIGAADGDSAFFLERFGYSVDIIDYGPTNYNTLRGARLLRDHLQSTVSIKEIDLDSNFILPSENYGLAIFLGILYHLKNPYYALESLSTRADHLLISTRIFKFAPTGEKLQHIPLAYLVAEDECNNDATNFWMFTEAGLKQIFERTGWEVLADRSVGDTENSDPRDMKRDERYFGILRSRRRTIEKV